MLFSLMAVLVLMVVAFFSLWMAATGRISGAEGPELSLGGRVLLLGAALVAFGVAYAVYHPQRDATPEAMSSTPPDSRGTAPTPPSPVETQEPVQAAATPPASTATKPSEPVEESSGLSASAMLLEAVELERRKRPDPAAVAAPGKWRMMDQPAVVATTASRKVAEPVVAAPRRARVLTSSRPRTTAHGPLLVHVHNRLGADQQSEQLSLSIEGLRVADIELDSGRPAVAVAVPLPRAGLLHYRLEGSSQDSTSTTLVGEGCIRVSDEAHFSVRRKDGSRKVFLEAVQVAR